jgi:energy-converting hydrogenase Eha subunit A
MLMQVIVWLALAAIVGGCAGLQLPPLAADHPANPQAPESVAAPSLASPTPVPAEGHHHGH